MTKLEEAVFHIHREKKLDVSRTDYIIRALWNEATKVVKNINETSTNEKDRQERLIKFEDDFGLGKTYLI